MTYFINSIAELLQCRKCTGWVYKAHLNGWQKYLDPNPIDFETEIAMRIANRRIFQTRPVGLEFEIEDRTLWHITNGDHRAKTLVEHSCQTPTIFEPEPIYQLAKSKEPNF